jgi:hypothetical protein
MGCEGGRIACSLGIDCQSLLAISKGRTHVYLYHSGGTLAILLNPCQFTFLKVVACGAITCRNPPHAVHGALAVVSAKIVNAVLAKVLFHYCDLAVLNRSGKSEQPDDVGPRAVDGFGAEYPCLCPAGAKWILNRKAS